MADSEARATLLIGRIGRFAPVRLAFAWSRNNRVPVILGQTNFFLEFDIRFCRSQMCFEIHRAASSVADGGAGLYLNQAMHASGDGGRVRNGWSFVAGVDR